MLGLATRARKTVSGTELVIGEIKKGKLKCIILASDLAENSQKEVLAALKGRKIPVIDTFSADEISQAVGKRRKVLALTDQGFAKALLAKINEGA